MVLVVKNPPVAAGDTRDMGSISGSGRSLGKGNGNLFQYSCLENPMGRGAWWATVQGTAKSWTRLGDWADTHLNTRDIKCVSACQRWAWCLKTKFVLMPAYVHEISHTLSRFIFPLSFLFLAGSSGDESSPVISSHQCPSGPWTWSHHGYLNLSYSPSSL